MIARAIFVALSLLVASPAFAVDVNARSAEISDILKIQSEWATKYTVWYGVYYAGGLLSILFSTLVASKPAILKIGESWYSLMAWLFAFITAAMSFLQPWEKGDRFNRAWSSLQSATFYFSHDDSLPITYVLKVKDQGEQIIHQTPSAPPKLDASTPP